MARDCDSYCSAIALNVIRPEDELVEGCVFSIEFDVTFTWVPSDDEEDIDSVQHVTFSKTREVQRDQLIGEATYTHTIQEMLFSMGVPVESFMIDIIVSTARDIADHPRYKDRKVLRMSVHLDIPVDEPVEEDPETSLRGHDEELAMVPAARSSIERLEMVVPASSVDCAICMEEVAVGSEANRLPCQHIFHKGCIVNWLETSKYCPLCRFEVP